MHESRFLKTNCPTSRPTSEPVIQSSHTHHKLPSLPSNARMSLRFVPYAVKMRRAGFVPTHTKSWSIYSPKWIQAPPPTPVVDMAAVDRCIATLTRFVAKWVAQSRGLRREYRIREAGDKWRRAAMSPSWADLGEAEERREVTRRRRQFQSWCEMPESQWKAVGRQMIADAADIGPLIRDILRPVWEERDRRDRDRARALTEVAQIWGEMARPRLHNRQRPAQVRVVRPRNRFDTGSDSE